jgi:hypothetical protein
MNANNSLNSISYIIRRQWLIITRKFTIRLNLINIRRNKLLRWKPWLFLRIPYFKKESNYNIRKWNIHRFSRKPDWTSQK